MKPYQEILTQIYKNVKTQNSGNVADYIPELAKINPEKFGIYIHFLNEENFGIGDFEERFSIQSISKVFSLALVYKILGEKIWERVGVEPSGNSFNSLVQLETDLGIPRNPFINAGALVICDMLLDLLENPKEDFLEFVRDIAENPRISYQNTVAQSEKDHGYRNIALCNFIKSFGNINNEPEKVMDLYFNMCSLEMSCSELSIAFSFLANSGKKISDGKEILTSSKAKRINALMQTCGFYDESGDFSFRVGLPGKSGVGGGIVALMPKQYVISVWSPRLNEKGNSHRGIQFLEIFTTETQESIF